MYYIYSKTINWADLISGLRAVGWIRRSVEGRQERKSERCMYLRKFQDKLYSTLVSPYTSTLHLPFRFRISSFVFPANLNCFQESSLFSLADRLMDSVRQGSRHPSLCTHTHTHTHTHIYICMYVYRCICISAFYRITQISVYIRNNSWGDEFRNLKIPLVYYSLLTFFGCFSFSWILFVRVNLDIYIYRDMKYNAKYKIVENCQSTQWVLAPNMVFTNTITFCGRIKWNTQKYRNIYCRETGAHKAHARYSPVLYLPGTARGLYECQSNVYISNEEDE
jgi:hypothetical protein